MTEQTNETTNEHATRPGARKKSTAVVGLTGGIACGKSTVAAVFRQLGARVIDADELAREVTQPGEPALAALARTFGADILESDGTLDRKKLGARVFGDRAAIAALNAITHPAILARTGKRLAEAQREGLGWVVYEAALILENRAEAGLSALVAVLCPPEAQRERLRARSGLSDQEIEGRIAAQTNDEVRRAKATWIIENDADIEALEARARATFEAIVERFGAPGG